MPLVKKKKRKSHRHRQQYGDYESERGVGEVGEGRGGIDGARRRFGLGGEHIMQYTGNLLQNCTPETYVILLKNVISDGRLTQ